jgi:competence protein ComEC
MRRPLLFWSFCLVVFLAVLHCRSDALEGGGPPDGASITIIGQVCQKDETSFILKIPKSAANQWQDNQNNQFLMKVANGIREERFLCVYESAPELVLGSTVAVEGQFSDFTEATNPGEFDYARYYHSVGYVGRLKNVSVVEASEPTVRWQEGLYRLRCYWERRLYAVFPEKEASVMAAILLGDKSGVDADVKAMYKRNGIIHILSISGLHITILGIGLYKLLRRLGLPVWFAAVTGGATLLLYGVLTGMGVSVCRAIGMYLLRMLANLWGRTYDMLTALGVAAAGMVCYHPAWLEHMGFLLSFGSILGVGALLPALSFGKKHTAEPKLCETYSFKDRSLSRLLKLWKGLTESLGQSLLAGISITLTTLPVQLWFAYEIPVYSVLLNIIVLPFMSVLMVAGMIAMLIPGLGIVGTADVVILAGYEQLCNLFEKLPVTMWNPGCPAVWQIVVYGLLWGLAVWMGARAQKKQMVQFGALTAAVLTLGLSGQREDRITFLDVGQGDCICVQTASGEVYLFDCGSSSRSNVGERVLIPFLKYYGIQTIDAVLVSHGDADHMNGIIELLELSGQEHIRVRQLVLPGIDSGLLQEEFGELLETVQDAGPKEKIAVTCIRAGDSWQSGGTNPDSFLCLHPSADGESPGGNEGSECFYLEMGQGRSRISVLLTGDVEGMGEQELIEELQRYNIRDVTLLKVAHHGSKYTTADALLEQIRPKAAVISCGRNNSYGHPAPETLERLAGVGSDIVCTMDSGAILLRIRNGDVQMLQWASRLLQHG